MKRWTKHFSILIVTLLLFANFVTAQDDLTITETVIQLAEEQEDFTILLDLVIAADLADVLADTEASFTVFAPTDAAFEALFESFDITQDDLAGDVDTLTQILLYHVVDGDVFAADLEDDMQVETLQGSELTINIDDDEQIILDGFAVVTMPDIETANGVIHVIDAVLSPSESSAETCTVSTDTERSASVHVGPGNNRTSVTFLTVGVTFEVFGQAIDDEDNIWFQLDKEEAAPGRSINEAWVAEAEVITSGDCENVGQAAAPPIIPIAPRAPSSNNDNSDDSNDDSNDDSDADADTSTDTGDTTPNTGSWTIFWNNTTNASCTGTGNISFPTTDVFGASNMAISTSVRAGSGNSFNFFGVTMTPIGGGIYEGASSVDGLTGTIYIDRVESDGNQMSGRFITSFDNCSATITFRADRG